MSDQDQRPANDTSPRAALASAEERYRTILETIEDGFYEVDLRGHFTFANDAIERVLRRPKADLLGHSYRQLVTGDTAALVFAAFNQVYRTGVPARAFGWEIIGPDGSLGYVEASISLILDASGEPVGFRGVVRDSTERRQAEETVRESEERHRQLLESLAEPVVIYDAAGKVSYANPAFTQTFGWTQAEIASRQVEFIPREYQADTQAAFDRARQVGFVRDLTSRRRARDGRTLDVRVSARALQDKQGSHSGLVVTVRDVSQRVQAERALQRAYDDLEQRVAERTGELARANTILQDEIRVRQTAEAALRQSEERYRLLLEASPDPIVVYDGDAHVTYANPAFSRLFGWSLAELGGKTVDFVPAGRLEEIRQLLDHAHHQGILPPAESQRLTRDGRLLDVQLSGSVALDRGGRPVAVMVVLRDITDSKRVEQTLQESLERRSRQVRLATQVAQDVAQATELADLYGRVVTLVKEQFGYYHAQLLRYEPAQQALLLVFGYGETGAAMLAGQHRIALGAGLVGVAAATGRSVLRPDVSGDLQWLPNPLLPGTRGELAVPIMLREQLLGVLDVQSDVPGRLSAEDQLLLEGLCGQIAIAIESTRLRQEMEERLRELNALQRIMSEAGWLAYRESRPGATAGFVYDTGGLQLLQGSGNGHGRPPAVTTPLAVRGAVIGAIGVEDDPERPLSGEERALLDAISTQVAEALEGARLFEQTQKRAAELETVARVSISTSTILEPQRLLQTVVDQTRESFGLYHAAVLLLDENEKTLTIAAGSGEIGRQIGLGGIAIPLDTPGSLIARAARNRQPVVVNDVTRLPEFFAHPLLQRTRSEMAVPMIVGERVLGVLDVQSEETDRFTDDDVKVQLTLASQVAVALQNAYLYAGQLETSAKLRQVDRLKSEFLASMSHELRTPLNSIIGFADVLLEGIDGDLNPRMDEDVRLIRESGRHLRELIGDILDMSRIEAGKMELRHEVIDARQLAAELLASAKTLAYDKDITLHLDVAGDVGMVYADRTRLMQIILNLVGNAIKFTERGSVTLALRQENGRLQVDVGDTGIGIGEEDLPIVFEQFRQVDGSMTRRAGGSGLGLPISKKLVELHGGQMWVTSQPGQGSVFSFTIPAGPATTPQPDGEPPRRRRKDH